jgi:hypothetical protein
VNFTFFDFIGLIVSVVIAFFVFGSISSKAGYPRWYGPLMVIPFLNIVLLVWFAYAAWPIETKLLQLELGGSKQPIWRDDT